MLKPFSPVVLVLGATAVWAVEDAPLVGVAGFGNTIGFAMSFDYVLPNDTRFSGTAIGYSLFLPVGDNVEVGIFHQEGFYRGRDNDTDTQGQGEGGGGGLLKAPAPSDRSGEISVRSRFDAVRASYRIYNDDVQDAKLFAAAGMMRFDYGQSVSAYAFDLGVEYNPWKITTRPVSSEFGVSATYRYCRFGDVDAFGTRPVNDGGGLLIGIHGLVIF